MTYLQMIGLALVAAGVSLFFHNVPAAFLSAGIVLTLFPELPWWKGRRP